MAQNVTIYPTEHKAAPHAQTLPSNGIGLTTPEHPTAHSAVSTDMSPRFPHMHPNSSLY